MCCSYRRFASLMLPALFFAWSIPYAGASNDDSAQANQKQTQDQKQKQSKTKDSGASLTGCIDEQNGHYVMISESTRDPIADLEAEGFETEGFAKHVGHKVTVRGTSNSGENRPIFRVRSIETVSDTCASQSLK